MNSFTDGLSGFVQKSRKASKRDKNVVVVLSVKKDVMDALAAGYSVRSIWLYLTELKRIQMGYERFRVHVNRHVRSYDSNPPSRKSKVTPSAPSDVPGFKFDPVPDKKRLLG